MKLTKSLAESPCHVAVFPFPYTSHPLSLLNLVRKLALASPTVRFSFLNTSNSNNSRFLSPIFQANLPDNITAYDHVEDGVPAGHVISGNSAKAMEFFLEASPENFKNVIDIVVAKTGTKITCLLVDALLSTCFADFLALRRLSFTPTSFANAALIAVLQLLIIKMKSLVLFLPDRKSPATSGCGGSKLFQRVESTGPPRRFRIQVPKSSQCRVSNGFLAATALTALKSDPTGCLTWSDGQNPSSMAYIAFGTQVTESVANGLPMICRPLFADNFMNAKMIENVWKIRVKVEGGVMTNSGLVKALEMVFSDDQNHGNKVKERAFKLKEIVTEAAGPNGNATPDFKTLVSLVSMTF
ncbi:hypothetical protein TIFTF001_027429 [Ficus carica]|uniref:Uncharacterized protein n=1 Tax=Ficus carica TaxID=3494 RepID=A0AA88IYI1_FICCA|nr:hypothetical protein TIFTF001_027429 [Ficus carica]